MMAPESAWPAHLRMHTDPVTDGPAVSSRLAMLELKRREMCIPLTADGYVSARAAARMLGRTPALLKKWRYQRRGPPFRKVNSQVVEYSMTGLATFLDEFAETAF